MSTAEYQRAYRARFGGTDPAQRARRKAIDEAGKWVRENHPDVWHDMLRRARGALALSTEVGPSGGFANPIPHGTYAGFCAHRYRGEDACDECLVARRQYDQRRYADRKSAS